MSDVAKCTNYFGKDKRLSLFNFLKLFPEFYRQGACLAFEKLHEIGKNVFFIPYFCAHKDNEVL